MIFSWKTRNRWHFFVIGSKLRKKSLTKKLPELCIIGLLWNQPGIGRSVAFLPVVSIWGIQLIILSTFQWQSKPPTYFCPFSWRRLIHQRINQSSNIDVVLPRQHSKTNRLHTSSCFHLLLLTSITMAFHFQIFQLNTQDIDGTQVSNNVRIPK